MATADFKINTSVQADRGYDATNSEAITLTLENAPAIDVYKVVYSVVTASDGAPAITFSPGSGQPTTPTGNVTFTTTGSGFHSYLIQCQVNDGKRQTDRGLVVDAGYTKQRMLVIRGALTNLRKTVPAETTQYGSNGWSVALNELADAVENGSVGGISTAEPIVTYGPALTIPNAVDLTALTATVAATSTTVQPLASRLSPSTNDTVLDVFSLRRSTTHASNGATGIGARMIVELEDSAGNIDSAAQHVWDYLDATSASEDTRYTIRLQVAGSLTDVLSLRGATVRVPAFAGGGSRTVTVDNNGDLGAEAASGLDATTAVLENTTTALNANGVPIQELPSQLEFIRTGGTPVKVAYKTGSTGTTTEALRLRQQVTSGGGVGAGSEAVKLVFTLPNGSGTETIAGSVRAVWQTVIGGGSSQLKWGVTLGGVHADAMTLTHTGVLDVPAGLTAASLDASSAGALTLGGSVATSIAASSLKITGLANGTTSTDAAAFGQIATAVNAAVSGTTNTLAKFTGTNVVGDGSITDASGTVNTTSVVTITKAGIGTTKTAGLYSINTTASGSQVSAQIGGSAKHSGGTQHNFGWQCEPQTAGRAIWRLCYGTGDPVSTPPANTGCYVDTSDPTYGVCVVSNAFMSNGGVGFRCSVGGGGVKENGGTGQVNFYGASTSIGTLLESALAVGDSDPCWDFYASAGTRTAGNFAQIRDGGGTVFAVSSATATRGQVSINGIPIGWNIVTTSTNVTVAIGDRVHVHGGGVTITLPSAPTVVSTRMIDIVILEIDGAALGSPITIAAAAGDLINGSSTATISAPLGGMQLCHDGDGTNWRIVGSHLL